jgi:hypothetical protein
MAVEALGPLTESPTGASKSMAALIDLAHPVGSSRDHECSTPTSTDSRRSNAYAGDCRAAFRLVRSG